MLAHFCHTNPMHLLPCANRSTYARHSSSYSRYPHLSPCKRQVHSTQHARTRLIGLQARQWTWSSTTVLTLARDQSVQELLTGSAICLAIRLTYWKLARCSIDSVGGRKKIMTGSEKSAGAKNVCDEWLSASQSRTLFCSLGGDS